MNRGDEPKHVKAALCSQYRPAPPGIHQFVRLQTGGRLRRGHGHHPLQAAVPPTPVLASHLLQALLAPSAPAQTRTTRHAPPSLARQHVPHWLAGCRPDGQTVNLADLDPKAPGAARVVVPAVQGAGWRVLQVPLLLLAAFP